MSAGALGAISPIERNSVADQVAKKILDLVRTGNLKPGDQLPPERELAQLLEVSRPSLREAMRGLQILGVVKSRQGGGAYISSLNAADLLGPLQFLITLNAENVHALYESRVVIDGAIARMAAERLSDGDLARLRRLVAAQGGLFADPIGFRVSDLEFHLTIMQSTDNPFLVRVSHSLYVLGMEYRRIASETAGVLRQSHADHEQIVAAFAGRDADAAEKAMVTHMRNVHRSTLDAMGQSPGGCG
jgi:GntR family transcriptional repressor for pyruvate dehydrogenase complex